METAEELLARAIETASVTVANRLFSLSELFREEDWYAMAPRTKMTLKTMFFRAVERGEIPDVEARDSLAQREIRMFIRRDGQKPHGYGPAKP